MTVTQEKAVLFLNLTPDINHQIAKTTIEPSTGVDALWYRMLMPFTSKWWALSKKMYSRRQKIVLVRNAGSTSR
jgi:hypothetical protein